MKSPLRYPGGKSRAVKIISQYFPSDMKTLVSPFFGGGSIEISQALRGVRVKGYDVFEPLVSFWNFLQSDREALHRAVLNYLPMTRKRFVELQHCNPVMEHSLEKAAVFYVLNRCSFSGSTMSGGMSIGHPRFNLSNAESILKFDVPSLTVENKSFEVSIGETPERDFLYLDPPYLLSRDANKLYGIQGSTHRNFDHETLYNLINQRSNWIMSYNDGDAIRDMYRDHVMIVPEWSYGMSKDKSSKEVLIFSKD